MMKFSKILLFSGRLHPLDRKSARSNFNTTTQLIKQKQDILKSTIMTANAIRQWVLATICTLAAFGSRAEEYLPFLETGKWWIVSETEVTGEFFSFWKMKVVSSETIAEAQYFNISVTRVTRAGFDENDNLIWAADKSPFSTLSMTLCENNGTVYRATKSQDGDYSLRQLFSIEAEYDNFERILSTVEINGEPHRCLYLDPIINMYPTYRARWIIEGIGPNWKFWGEMRPTCYDPGRSFDFEMIECYKDDQLLFKKEDFDDLVATVKNEVEAAASDSPDYRSITFDLQGKPIAEPNNGEIYISDGKKIIRK